MLAEPSAAALFGDADDISVSSEDEGKEKQESDKEGSDRDRRQDDDDEGQERRSDDENEQRPALDEVLQNCMKCFVTCFMLFCV